MCANDEMKVKNELPKQILVIRDCTFILPDDFSGDLNDAFTEFLKYHSENRNKAKYFDDLNLFSTFEILMQNSPDLKVCGEYKILEHIDGKYVLKEGTGPK